MMNRKVKFKISIKELSVEFEGDIQTAERIQQQVTGAINNLATAPNRLIGAGQQQSATDVIDVSPHAVGAVGGRRPPTLVVTKDRLPN